MPPVEVFRSNRQAACEHFAFVLGAVGIASETIPDADGFVLFVASESAAAARHHVERYLEENQPAERIERPPTFHDRAWIAPMVYGLVLVIVGYLAGRNAFGFDWYAAGALHSSMQTKHELWRAVTALTLHVDQGHLLTNIGFGALFSFAAARSLGSGVAFAGMMFAAIAGNVLDSLLMPNNHVSIGASTAVFAALGLISAYSWHLPLNRWTRWSKRWMRRGAPLIAGIALLGLLGSGGGDASTDILAHLTGFFCGAVSGSMLARISPKRFANSIFQFAAGIATLALLVGAWFVGLRA